MADEKTIYKMKTPDGNPVRVEEAWKDANGELLTEKVNKADAQTITGLKTFSTLPQSSATPTDDKDLATKKYSDDLWATRKAQEEKCYQALKTVTKDFTRTDPVHVRIGEDGEPEIHYTMTRANSGDLFWDRDYGNATLYIHKSASVAHFTIFNSAFYNTSCKRIVIDDFAEVTDISSLVQMNSTLETIEFPDCENITAATAAFWGCRSLKAIPAFNCAKIDSLTNAFDWCVSCERFLPYGMIASFSLSSTALKHDAILEVFNNLGTGVAEGTTLTLGSAKLALMSDEEKKIATDKGWTLA